MLVSALPAGLTGSHEISCCNNPESIHSVCCSLTVYPSARSRLMSLTWLFSSSTFQS